MLKKAFFFFIKTTGFPGGYARLAWVIIGVVRAFRFFAIIIIFIPIVILVVWVLFKEK